MDYVYFIQGLFVWATVASIIFLITYGLAYFSARFFGRTIKKKPWHMFLIILIGCEGFFIIQSLLREFGFSPDLSRYILTAISIGIMIVAILFDKLIYKKKDK